MFSSGPSYSKLKTNLRLAINRLKLLEKKKTELTQKARKEIADYISTGKVERAKIRVEHIIREDYLVEAMEVTEMYCDLVLARFGLVQQMKDLDPGLSEALSSLIWCAPRLMTDVPELKVIADQLALKYGKPYAMACREQSVSTISEKLIHKLSVQAPPKILVEKYLQEIAHNYNLEYTPDPQVMREADWGSDPLISLDDPNNRSGGGASGGACGGGGGGGGGMPQQPFSYPSKVATLTDPLLPSVPGTLLLPSPSLEDPSGRRFEEVMADPTHTLEPRTPSGTGGQGPQDLSLEDRLASLRGARTSPLDTLRANMMPSFEDVDDEATPIPVSSWAPSVLLTNPQSLTNCFPEFVELVKHHEPDIVVVSETWFSDSRPASGFELEGYFQFHDDREMGRRGGGVAIYAKTHVKRGAPPAEDDAFIVAVNPHTPQIKVAPELECLWVCLGGNTYVCGVYHAPNASTGKLLFDHIVNATLDLRKRFGSDAIRLIVAGDFNHLSCDRLNASLGIRNLVQEPTHQNSTIDLILTDTPQHYATPLLLPPLHSSKHNCVLLKPSI